jgi:membrane-bound ClpP family serine protease
MVWWMYVLLLALGVMMILLEILTPHGIAAVCGFAVVVVSAFLCIYFEGWQTGLLYTCFALVLASFCSMHALRAGVKFMALKPTPDPNSPSAAPAQPQPVPELGALATVVQTLRPTGTIEWQGRRFAARTLSPELELARGAQVTIRDRDSIYYLVEPADPQP